MLFLCFGNIFCQTLILDIFSVIYDDRIFPLFAPLVCRHFFVRGGQNCPWERGVLKNFEMGGVQEGGPYWTALLP